MRIRYQVLGARDQFVGARRARSAESGVLFEVAQAQRPQPALARRHRQLQGRQEPALPGGGLGTHLHLPRGPDLARARGLSHS